MQHKGFEHPKNKSREEGIPLFEYGSGICYHDFYKKGRIVLDAKYKRLENYDKVSNVCRTDLYQLIAYVSNLKTSRGGFVAPLTERLRNVPTSRLKNPSSTLFIIGIDICNTATSYADFCQKMKVKEDEFIEELLNLQ